MPKPSDARYKVSELRTLLVELRRDPDWARPLAPGSNLREKNPDWLVALAQLPEHLSSPNTGPSLERFINDVAEGENIRGELVRAWEVLHSLRDARKADLIELQKVLTYFEETNISRADFEAFYRAEADKARFFRRCKVVDNIDFLTPFRWFDAFRIDKPRVLILGEGNFSFSKSITPYLSEVNRSNLLVTELRSYEDLLAASNIDNNQLNDALSFLETNGIEVRFEIDGTNLPADLGNFDVVIFNFPWTNHPGNSLSSTRLMLEGVMSQMDTRLNSGGKIFLSQKEYWAAPNKLDFISLSNNTSLNLLGDKNFSAQEFSNYSHVVSNPDGTTANVTTGITYIFSKE